MADYFWNPAGLTEPVLLPSTVTDTLLTLASAEQLRVLLWLSRHRLTMDPTACAAAVGLSPDECAGCVDFWVEQGVLAPRAVAEPSSAPSTKKAALPRPVTVKPQLREVLEYQKAHPDFAGLVQDVSARLGKAIGHNDTATLLYLLDTVGLPPQVIILEVAYAVSIGKPNLRYIEKIALDWADQELTTLETVDAHIRRLEACRMAAKKVEGWLMLPRPLTAAQAQLADKWLNEWQVREEMLRLADKITREKTGKFSPAYTDRILERWYAEGIDTPEKATVSAAPSRRSGVQATNPAESSLELENFEQELIRYTPVFHKEKAT